MNVATGELVDPLKSGVNDIKNKRLNTVTDADKVFAFDGLRLLRLARFAGELDFKPTEDRHRLIRLYVGLEEPDYIIADLKQAFEKLK